MTEDQHQIALVTHWRLRRAPGWEMWHTPNGGLRTPREAAKLKALGTLPGVPDLLLLSPEGRLHGLELKAGRNKPTDEQEAFGQHMLRVGLTWAWSGTLDRSLGILESWGALRQNAVALQGGKRNG